MIEEPFVNEQIEVEHIPKANVLQYIPLERDYLKVSLIISGIFSGIFIIGGIVLAFGLHNRFPSNIRIAIFCVALALAGLILFLAYKGYHYKSYALRQKDIVYKSGYIFRNKTTIPFNRVQHCEVNQGPIDRMFNLSSLKIFTAGGSSSDMSIGGLRPDVANDLKQFIVKKTALEEEE